MPPITQATLHTSMGDIVIELFPNHAPKTVANFVDLATGAKEWVDPNIGEKVKTNLYDGTIFHRVIPGFMIQGGDPMGSGMGGPGYNFADEFQVTLRFCSRSKVRLRAHSSAWLERFPDKEEVGGSSPPGPTRSNTGT